MQKKPIRTIADVADYLGAAHPTNESISRRVYKDTACGAWAKVETEPVCRELTFRARFVESILGTMLVEVRRSGRAIPLRSLPAEVRDFCCVKASGRHLVFDEDRAGAGLHEVESDDRMKVTRNNKLTTYVTFRTKVPVGQRTVFRVGSIVEGSDAEVFPETVPLPCHGEQIDKAIEVVESAANDIWLNTHGCEDCNTDENDHRVNPDCLSCGGDGVVI